MIIRYSECYVGQVVLPVDSIVKNYPSMKTIIWDYEGLCTYAPTDCSEGKRPTIHGCERGKTYPVRIKLMSSNLQIPIGQR